MNAHLHAAQHHSQELQAEAQRDREARTVQKPGERPNLLGLVKVLILARQPRLS